MAVVIATNPKQLPIIPDQKYQILCTKKVFFYGFNHKLHFFFLFGDAENSGREFLTYYIASQKKHYFYVNTTLFCLIQQYLPTYLCEMPEESRKTQKYLLLMATLKKNHTFLLLLLEKLKDFFI